MSSNALNVVISAKSTLPRITPKLIPSASTAVARTLKKYFPCLQLFDPLMLQGKARPAAAVQSVVRAHPALLIKPAGGIKTSESGATQPGEDAPPS